MVAKNGYFHPEDKSLQACVLPCAKKHRAHGRTPKLYSIHPHGIFAKRMKN